jgi:DNA mismatch repair protein MutS
VPGATDRSYGIHVARIAGVPHAVTNRAREILEDIENECVISDDDRRGRKKQRSSAKYTQVILFDQNSSYGAEDTGKKNPVLEELTRLDLNTMTPLEALNKLHDLKGKLCGDETHNDR